jgi:hypothetical protein
MAKAHQDRYLRFKADEASQTITGKYRQLHPEDNNERQTIHEHVSMGLNEVNKHPAAGGKTYSNGNAAEAPKTRVGAKDSTATGVANSARGPATTFSLPEAPGRSSGGSR